MYLPGRMREVANFMRDCDAERLDDAAGLRLKSWLFSYQLPTGEIGDAEVASTDTDQQLKYLHAPGSDDCVGLCVAEAPHAVAACFGQGQEQ